MAELLDLVILDRDGVLNHNRADHVTRVDQWSWIPGSRRACRRLIAGGTHVAVVTNQAALGRGVLTATELSRIHDRLLAGIAVPRMPAPLILHCPHVPTDGCRCRKPRPGMVDSALRHFDVRPVATVLIGDHLSDLTAAAAAGCWSAHVRSGRGTPPDIPPPGYLGSFHDLASAVETLPGIRPGSGTGTPTGAAR